MKFDISRQTLFPATLILLVLAVAMIWFGPTETAKPSRPTGLTEQTDFSGESEEFEGSAGSTGSAKSTEPAGSTIQSKQTAQAEPKEPAEQTTQAGQTRQPEQAERATQTGQTRQPEPAERATQAGRTQQPEQAKPTEQTERTEWTERTEQTAQAERATQAGRIQQPEQAKPTEQTERTERTERTEQTAQAEPATQPGAADNRLEPLGGEMLGEFLVRHPFMGRLLLLVLTLATGLTVGRTGIRFALYPVKTCIGISLFGFLGCGVTGGEDLPMAIVAVYCWARTLNHYLAALRHGYSFDRLFRGSMFLGLVPLVQPVLTPLVLVLPLVLLQFKRTTREGIVAVAGLLFVPLLAGYLSWACGLSFWEPVRPVMQAMRLDGEMLWTQLPPYIFPALGLTLLLVIYTLGCFIGDRHSLGNRKWVLYPLLFYAFMLCVALLALPVRGGGVVAVTMAAAVVTALLLPYLFVRLQRTIALAAYAGVAVLSLLGIGFGLFL